MSTAPTRESSSAVVLEAITKHTQAGNPSSFLAMNTGNELFTVPDADGVVVYRQAGRHLVQFGGPFAGPGSYERLLTAFQDHAQERELRLVAVQLQRADAEIYARLGWTVNQIGASWAVGLPDFTLRGTRFMQLRNKISRAFRNGLQVREADAQDVRDALAVIDTAWLADKGEHVRPLEFLVGQTGGSAQRHRRLFVGSIDGTPVGYISYSPAYGPQAGWMHDLSRRLPGNSPGLMEAINSTAIEAFRAEGAQWLHFGFTPFTGLDAANELPGHSPAFTWLMHFLWEHGEDLYPARTQLAYKEKWGPDLTLPEYVAFRGQASPVSFAHVFRACNAF
ncbi:bifunctional lysylphosphatidylglycerol flippase/synthetase MprF [Streptomyces adustus]